MSNIFKIINNKDFKYFKYQISKTLNILSIKYFAPQPWVQHNIFRNQFR